MNLIPEEEPRPSIFGISKRVLTRPKSHGRFRPFSVSATKRQRLAVNNSP